MKSKRNILDILDSRQRGEKRSTYSLSLFKRNIPFSSLFPAIGSLHSTVILGFTKDGNYLLSTSTNTINFHQFLFSLKYPNGFLLMPKYRLSYPFSLDNISSQKIEVIRNVSCDKMIGAILYSQECICTYPLPHTFCTLPLAHILVNLIFFKHTHIINTFINLIWSL